LTKNLSLCRITTRCIIKPFFVEILAYMIKKIQYHRLSLRL